MPGGRGRAAGLGSSSPGAPAFSGPNIHHRVPATALTYQPHLVHQLKEKKELLARLETIDAGKPIAEAKWDMDDVAGCFEYYADLAEQLDKRQVGAGGHVHLGGSGGGGCPVL